jgi:broad specificity phosphatase PhoE
LRILLALLFVLSASPALAAAPDTTLVSTVILVRHAEKNEHPPGGDAGLATKGLVRARELARVLEGARVRAVYASQYGRTRLTAEPLAAAIGDSVRTYDAKHLDALAARVRKEGQGGTVVLVGHGGP